jgi:hypothetical protein
VILRLKPKRKNQKKRNKLIKAQAKGVMMSRFSLLLVFSLLFSLISCAEDEAKKVSKPKEEKPKENNAKEEKVTKTEDPSQPKNESKPKEEKSATQKPKVEVKDIEIEGVVIKRELKNSKVAYYIKTQDKFLVRIPEKIGDKEVSLEQFNDKAVLLKGKGELNILQANQKEVKSYKLHQAFSIAIQSPIAPEKPATEIKKPDEKKSDEKKLEEKKSDK